MADVQSLWNLLPALDLIGMRRVSARFAYPKPQNTRAHKDH